MLIVELEGERPQVASEFERLMRILAESGATETRVAADEDERARIWKGRKSAFSAVGRLSPDFIVQDGVVPRARLGRGAGGRSKRCPHATVYASPMCFMRATETCTR